MCILFVKIVQSPKEGQYKLIVASNRDEFYTRPSEPAHFWKEDAEILGGRDMTQKKEGGTWLAVSKKGKMGVVLNFSGGNSDSEKLGRGFLVANFLRSSQSGTRHLDNLKNVSNQYNKFHLVTIEFKGDPILNHYSNGDSNQEVISLSDGVFAIGNSPIDKPYEKVRKGKMRFEDIVEKYNDHKSQDKLVEELLALLKWEEKHLSSQEEMSHLPKDYREPCSSVFIDLAPAGYGTRTHTIVLVDETGKIDFYEWTLKEPIDPSNREWISTHQEFKIHFRL